MHVAEPRDRRARSRWLDHPLGRRGRTLAKSPERCRGAIGNAPTALFRLLELLDEGAPRPAVVLAFPVGFIGAAEAKEALIERQPALPHIALRGRRGGSGLAAAAVNALALEAQ